jgi:hypothetical protein
MPRGRKHEPTVEPSEADYWYAAGFIDGEGCITVRVATSTSNKWNQSMFASVSASQVDRDVLAWMQERWGGSIRRIPPRRPKQQDCWEWVVVSQQAYVFLEGVRGMLKVKGRQAENALRLRDLRKARGWGNALTAEEVAVQAEIRAEASRLNQLGKL